MTAGLMGPCFLQAAQLEAAPEGLMEPPKTTLEDHVMRNISCLGDDKQLVKGGARVAYRPYILRVRSMETEATLRAWWVNRTPVASAVWSVNTLRVSHCLQR